MSLLSARTGMVRLLSIVLLAAMAVVAAWMLRMDGAVAPGEPAASEVPAGAPSAALAAPQAVRDAAPVAAVPPPSEPDHDEWDRLRRQLGAGELEALVVRGRQPLAGVRVRVWQCPSGRIGAHDRGPCMREGLTDAAGRVRFDGIAAGAFAVRGDAEGRYVEALATVGLSEAGSRTVVLAFGSASIVGSVLDEAGRPLVGELVHIICTYPHCAVVAITDAAGAFEVGALTAGRYHVQLEQPPGQWSAANERMLSLRVGERARMDFGGPPPAGSLHGRIVDAEGAVVPGVHRLRARHVVHNDERRVATDAQGDFVLPLPPGRWELFVDDYDAPDVIASVDVDNVVVRADVRWPGIRLLAVVAATPDVDMHDLGRCLELGAWHTCLPNAVFSVGDQWFLQWTRLVPGEYRLHLGGPFYFVDTPLIDVVVKLTDAPVQRVFVNVRR